MGGPKDFSVSPYFLVWRLRVWGGPGLDKNSLRMIPSGMKSLINKYNEGPGLVPLLLTASLVVDL